jgi:FkbM family methyltransferase
MRDSKVIELEEASGVQKRGLIYHLGKVPVVHRLVSKLGMYQMANAFLEKFPIIRKLPSQKYMIRINSVAAIALAEEMFSGKGYRGIFGKYPVSAFIDLGCNIGWFPCFLAEEQQTANIIGLMFDADPRVIEHTKWHLSTNGFTGCEVVHGIVGIETKKEAPFYLNPANTQSAAKSFGNNHPFPIKGKVKEMKVPVRSVADEWTLRHGDQKVDLLKIDIEGAELDFIRNEIKFIRSSVIRILCEWHNWHVTFEEINIFLTENNFEFILVTERDENGGVAFFRNKSLS